MDYKTVNSDCQFLPLVVSTGSTTVHCSWPVLSTAGGFDRLNHCTLLLACSFYRWWFRQAQPLFSALGFKALRSRAGWEVKICRRRKKKEGDVRVP
jgi:hypothetical protein